MSRVGEMRNLIVCILLLLISAQSAPAGWILGETAYKRGDFATAFREWLTLAQDGNIEAQYNIGVMYSQGQGVSRDMASAALWWEKAALQGDKRGQNNIANLYRDGLGVAKDLGKASHWFKDAAARDYPAAQYDLGMLYQSGQGVAKVSSPACL